MEHVDRIINNMRIAICVTVIVLGFLLFLSTCEPRRQDVIENVHEQYIKSNPKAGCGDCHSQKPVKKGKDWGKMFHGESK